MGDLAAVYLPSDDETTSVNFNGSFLNLFEIIEVGFQFYKFIGLIGLKFGCERNTLLIAEI
jgi:hypothetical protein